jgi:hypothetical protein
MSSRIYRHMRPNMGSPISRTYSGGQTKIPPCRVLQRKLWFAPELLSINRGLSPNYIKRLPKSELVILAEPSVGVDAAASALGSGRMIT